MFQQWRDRKGRQAICQKIAQMSTHLVHGQAGGARAGGAGIQKQLQKYQELQQDASCCNLAGGEGRVMEAFVTKTGVRQQDTREEAVTRAAAVLNNAKKCPVCQDVTMFNICKHENSHQHGSTSAINSRS